CARKGVEEYAMDYW
nr:immunoglobulin heavy chain junction region [Mus musculus]